MPDPDRSSSDVLPPAVADRVLARAAELDAARAAGTSVARLRETALDAGIAPAAFEAALREAEGGEAEPGAAAAVPLWVRLCLIGVRERRVAMAYDWLFTATLFATFAATVGLATLAPARLPEHKPLLLFLGVWALFAVWSTSRAVRRADRHGWDRLP